MYIKRILLIIVLAGLVIGGIFAYNVYGAIFNPNTSFQNEEAAIFIHSEDTFEDVKNSLEPLLEDITTFEQIADRKGYSSNIKPGKYAIRKGMSNNDIVNSLRSHNLPVKVAFNNQERLEDLAGRIAAQIEPDSLTLLKAFQDAEFLEENGFDAATKLVMYIPNSYEFFWNTSAEKFRDRFIKEFDAFWNESRIAKAKKLNFTRHEVITLASIVQKETAQAVERPLVAGLYLNRIRDGWPLGADPTIIFALKQKYGQDKVYKRVLTKDLKIDSPYNTYINRGLPPALIAMPDISAIDAVLNDKRHDYYYMCASVTKLGYHEFAKTLAQHNVNASK